MAEETVAVNVPEQPVASIDATSAATERKHDPERRVYDLRFLKAVGVIVCIKLTKEDCPADLK